ncbi:DUF6160 family protein, partial [Pseudomonas aeruginosa]
AASQAAMEALDNDSLSQVTGQAGISLRLDLRAGAARVAWVDDGGSLSLRNLVIDNGCVKAGDCPDGRGGNIPLGAAAAGGHVQCQGRLLDAEDRQAQAELGGAQGDVAAAPVRAVAGLHAAVVDHQVAQREAAAVVHPG